MPAGHVLAQVQAQQTAEAPARDDLEDAGVERREAQHVSDLQQAAGAFRGLHHAQAVGRVGGDRLLEQHVVAGGERRQRGLHVERVSGGDDRDGRYPGAVQQGLPVLEERRRGETVIRAHGLAATGVGLGDGHHP